MRILLLWRRGAERRDTKLDRARVSAALQRLFAPLLPAAPHVETRAGGSSSMVFLHLPVSGWRLPFFEEDTERWAVAPDYPTNAVRVLGGRSDGEPAVLLALARALETEPAAVLRELAPPVSLVWSRRDTGETFVQNDGLGQAQLFEYDDGETWALTNKLAALQAVGIRLEPVPEEWATRSTLGWFPLNTTGFQRIRFVAPGTRIRLGAAMIERVRIDVLSDWLGDRTLTSEDCMELARDSLLEQLRAVAPFWEQPSVGLSGGWDSRVVVAALRFLGLDFSARVRGLAGTPDVEIAHELARVAGFPLRHKSGGALPPQDGAQCRRSIRGALLWQGGHMVTSKQKSFLRGERRSAGDIVNVMGQHGEIGRGYYYEKLCGATLDPSRYRKGLVNLLSVKMPPFLRERHRDHVLDTIGAAYDQADRYALSGAAALDFFYLYERTRRWASASLAAQRGLVIAPFLTAGYVRAVFAHRDSAKDDDPFHRFILRELAPEWVGVPFAGSAEQGATAGDASRYWDSAGASLITEALASDGFWTEVFDPDRARREWRAAPDDLLMLYLLPGALGIGKKGDGGN